MAATKGGLKRSGAVSFRVNDRTRCKFDAICVDVCRVYDLDLSPADVFEIIVRDVYNSRGLNDGRGVVNG